MSAWDTELGKRLRGARDQLDLARGRLDVALVEAGWGYDDLQALEPTAPEAALAASVRVTVLPKLPEIVAAIEKARETLANVTA